MKPILLALCIVTALAQSPEALLGSALHQERVTGNLQAAIDGFKKVLAAKGVSRATATQAQYHIGLCYERLGNQEARKAFELVVRNYADQQTIAGQARARLAPAAAVGDRAVWTGPNVDIFGRISPDGRYLTYVDLEKAGNLMLHDLSTGEDLPLTVKKNWEDLEGGTAGYSTISRDGKQIAYKWDGELRITPFTRSPITTFRLLSSNVMRPFDWSPDGKWIAVQVRQPGPSYEVGLLSTQDGSFKKFRDTSHAGPRNMVFSTDGRYVAFDMRGATHPNRLDIHIAAVDGSGVESLAEPSSDERVVGFSADGSYLLYTSDLNRTVDLWARRFVNGKLEGLPINAKPDFGRAWIQGMWNSGVIFATKSVNGSDIYVMPLDLKAGAAAGPAKALGAFPYRGRPAWSPDGQQLAMVDCGQFGAEGCSIQIWSKATGRTRVLEHELGEVQFPRWSLDGKQLVTAGQEHSGKQGLFRIDVTSGATTMIVANASGMGLGRAEDPGKFLQIGRFGRPVVEIDLGSGARRELGRIPARQTQPGVSPDGRSIAYVTDDGVVAVVPTAGGSPREIYRIANSNFAEFGGSVEWTLDGTALFVTTGGRKPGGAEFWLARLTGEARKLNLDTRALNYPYFASIAISPDGKDLAFVSGNKSDELWAISVSLPKP